jgi:hypothetical protein
VAVRQLSAARVLSVDGVTPLADVRFVVGGMHWLQLQAVRDGETLGGVPTFTLQTDAAIELGVAADQSQAAATLKAAQPTSGTLAFVHDGDVLVTLPVAAVTQAELVSFELREAFPSPTSTTHYAIPVGRDAAGRAVYGASPSWTMTGFGTASKVNLFYRWVSVPSASHTLTATIGTLSASIDVHGEPPKGQVDEGMAACTVAPGAAGGNAGFIVLVLLLILLVDRIGRTIVPILCVGHTHRTGSRERAGVDVSQVRAPRARQES